jgi:CRISPR-associated protein Cmr6
MRQVLRDPIGGKVPGHLGLAYDAWAPTEVGDGKVSDDRRRPWLEKLAELAVSPDYARSFERWKGSFSATGDRLAELTLASRLLIGHGNASAIDVGLTVHHTWGVPVIPGSALKGLVAHYVDATYGPTDASKNPWEQQGDERVRADYQGVTRNGRRIERGPGVVYRALFGAPDAREDETMRENGFEAGAAAGFVTFHDALYVPGSLADNKPFAADVLTVHQTGTSA